MNKTISLAAIAVLLLIAGCKEQPFKTTNKGNLKLEYKTFGGSGVRVKYGNAVKYTLQTYYSDSLLSTPPFDTVPQIIEIDSTRLPAEYLEIFTSAYNGDSIITRVSTDSLMKVTQLPPFAQKGKYLSNHFKILDVLTDPIKIAAAKTETMNEMKRIDSIATEKQKGIDDKTISDYLAKNNIRATKTAKGTYVEITTPGDGPAVDSGEAVTVDYRAKTLEGTEFDSSYDSTGKSVKPYTFVVGQARGAIEGWSDGLKLFKKGGKGRLFIPSYLAYGSRGAGGVVKPNTPLMFDVSVEDVMSADKYKAMMQEKQKEMVEQFNKMREKAKEKTKADSIANAKKK
ncbi:MAG TPA: FKBP-type peptidyl-prolyl cis-trans isomerase [Chitinophagaceae bacterium]|nr:FKBP-type peptidyl-prolyl cis-trans isomerase [Chitinophagaceae bacterium]